MTTDKIFVGLTRHQWSQLLDVLQKNLWLQLHDIIKFQVESEQDLYEAVSKEFARRGGSVKSDVKAQAARESGKLGGRPRKISEIIKHENS